MRKHTGLLLFLYGMFSMTQIRVIGYIGISELVVYCVAPFLYLKDRSILKKDGFSTYISMTFLAMAGCALSAWWNKSPFVSFAKVFAAVYALFAHAVVMHRLLRQDIGKLKWIIIGIAISSVVSIFIFQTGSSLGDEGEYLTAEDATKRVTGYALFWASLVNRWLLLPVRISYLNIPFVFSAAAVLFCGVFSILTTSSGRAALLTTLLAFLLLFFGRKKAKNMRSLGKWILPGMVLFLLFGGVVARTYKSVALAGYLGEESRQKYEKQMEGRKEGIISVLIGGRGETFAGLYVALHHFIVGVGPKGVENEGLVRDFFMKYGSVNDIEQYYKTMSRFEKAGLSRGVPAHSHIVSFWLWCGLPGIFVWIYVLYLMFSTLKNCIWAVPQWYAYIVLQFCTMLWAIFFSPFGDRTGAVLFITALLLVRAVANREIALPAYMIEEIRRHA